MATEGMTLPEVPNFGRRTAFSLCFWVPIFEPLENQAVSRVLVKAWKTAQKLHQTLMFRNRLISAADPPIFQK